MPINPRPLPTFLLCGASKTGTTTLYDCLRQHPEVFVPTIKEPGFFAFEGQPDAHHGRREKPFVTNWDRYTELFAEASSEDAIGDCSPQYFDNASPQVVNRIKHYLPHTKVVLVLRNPLTWALSTYHMRKRDGMEVAASFDAAIRRERIAYEAGQTSEANYVLKYPSDSDRLQLFLKTFSADNLRIFLYDDFLDDREKFVRNIYAFIGVDPRFQPDMFDRKNVSGIPRNRLFAYLLNRHNPVRTLVRHLASTNVRERIRGHLIKPIPNAQRQQENETLNRLRDDVREEVLRLQALIGRDLGHWLK